MTSPAEMIREMQRLSDLLDAGLSALRDNARTLAQAEHDYRKGQAAAWAQAPDGTVPEREAWVNAETADLRRSRDVAEHMRRAADLAVRSRQTQISALQTIANVAKAEAEFARTGPDRG